MARLPVKLLVLFACLMIPAGAWADSCPYCGQTYGEGSGSDSSYISSIRAAHESECAAAHSSSSSSGGYSTGYSSYRARRQAQEEYEMMLIMQEQERRRLEEEARQKKIQELKVQREEGQAQWEAGWQEKKESTMQSLKGPGGGMSLKSGHGQAAQGVELKLKTSGPPPEPTPAPIPAPVPVPVPTQGSVSKYYNTLTIPEIPPPDLSGKNAIRPEKKDFVAAVDKKVDATFAYLNEHAPLVLEYGSAFLKTARETYREQVIDNIYDCFSPFKTAMDKFSEGKKLYDEQMDLRMDVYTHASKGMEEGIGLLASPRTRDGGFSERYYERTLGIIEGTGHKTAHLISEKVVNKYKEAKEETEPEEDDD